MTKNFPEIQILKEDIEESVGRRMKTPSDFEFLAGVIWERIHNLISPTTLKRLWGYIDGADKTRRSTLNILSKFLSFDDWDVYMLSLKNRDIESDFILSDKIDSKELSKGDMLEVTWQPNRHCEFEYLGDMKFIVRKADNSKLQVGDKFECMFFIQNEPLYMDNLEHKGQFPVAYVAGSKSGITARKI